MWESELVARRRLGIPLAVVAAVAVAEVAAVVLRPRSGVIHPADVKATDYFSPAEIDRARAFRRPQLGLFAGTLAVEAGLLAWLVARPAPLAGGALAVLAIGSLAVLEPIEGLQLSNAHRPGLVAAFKVLARTVARDGVTLNTVHPGLIATDRVLDTAGSREAAEENARETVPAGRLGTVEELAAAAVFLCSRQAAYITGTTLLVDGGMTRSV
jgi:NAD(P)-dependent dehydrogenase (short-subunit alcohol dehydrogenase family)